MRRLVERAPEWKEIFPGVRLLFAPVTRAAWRAAQIASRDAGQAALEDGANDEGVRLARADAISDSLLRHGIMDWEGVGDADGNPVKPTPELVDLFLSDPRHFDYADAAYVAPFIFERAEGNASSGSPAGTTEKATPESDTASSHAAPTPAGAATNAPIGSTSSGRKKARKSGS